MRNESTIRQTIYIKILLILMVVFICMGLADKNSFLFYNVENNLSNISVEDISFSVIDEKTVSLENLITGNGLTYSWIIKNYSNEREIYSEEMLELPEYVYVEFETDDIEKIEFQAVVCYDGYTYTSATFGVKSDGALYMVSNGTGSIVAADEVTRSISDIVSLAFLLFLLIVVMIYYVVPKKYQRCVLLGASLIFYLLSGVQYIVFVILSSFITYTVARKMSDERVEVEKFIKNISVSKERKVYKEKLQQKNKNLLSIAFISTLGVMIMLKYSSFAIENVNILLHTDIPLVTLIMPLGLSFYTFMLIAYLIDVYRGKYIAEANYAKLLLFVSFFPHISQGPISRYDELSIQFKEKHSFNYEQFCFASQRILWGFFIKLVLADKIAIFVNAIYTNYETQGWFMLTLASLAYSIQMYADFYSSMEIAIGAAELFGIKLSENFMRPYFSTNMPEFWRRWHITLGTWFKEYVFYPISISKKLMKFSVKIRMKYGSNTARIVAAVPPILGVWILTGLWHGASWTFVAWGLFHGILILLSTVFSQNIQNLLVKIGIKTETLYYRIIQMIKVFILCTIGRVFFRSTTISMAFTIFKRIFSLASSSVNLDYKDVYDIDIIYCILVIGGMLLLLIVSLLQEKYGNIRNKILRFNIVIRWCIWLSILFATILFGEYGAGATPVFLYGGF